MLDEGRDVQAEIMALIGGTAHDPLAYAQRNWDWGHGFLADRRLEDWQVDTLGAIGDDLKAGRQMIRVTVRSGHGIGKTTLLSILSKWAVETAPGTKGRITANTETQLKSVVMPTIRQWNGLSLTKDWIELATKRVQASRLLTTDENLRESWRLDLVPFSDKNPVAFQGLHNKGLRLFIVVEEASGLPDSVYETIQGALAASSDTEVILFFPGNCNRNTGFFHAIHTKNGEGWHRMKVDSRDTTLANQEEIERWRVEYGEDSDFFRVRVRGEFPRASAYQFFDGQQIIDARRRKITASRDDEIVMSIDVGRQGPDRSVIAERHGYDCAITPWTVVNEADTMKLVSLVVSRANWLQENMRRWPDAIFVDTTGVGGPVADRLRELLPHTAVIDVDFGAGSTGPVEGWRARNMRTEIHLRARAALTRCRIPDLDELAEEMEAIEFGYSGDGVLTELAKKDDVRKLIGRSPDLSDAYAMLWTMPVTRRSTAQVRVEHEHHRDDWMPGGESW